MPFSFCVLSAVSQESQATEDKDSLDHQLRTARAYGESLGGTFVREYRAEGFSRSGYFNLSDLFHDAPPFAELGKGVLRHDFDVILLESFDRLGDVGYMLWNYCKPHRIQLRSVQQALPIHDPATYDPTKDDLTPTVINNSLNTNVYRIHKLNRAFEVGIAKRAKDGLYARRLPYAYIKTGSIKDKNLRIELVPDIAALIAKFPAWFLSGESLYFIADIANASGVPSRTGRGWTYSSIKYILESPFYAGKVYNARGNYTGKKHRKHYKFKPRNEVELFDGIQPPLWSYETHLQILDELERRKNRYSTKHDYNLSRIIKCYKCGKSLLVAYDQRYPNRLYWKCREAHVHIPAKKAEAQITTGLIELFKGDTTPQNVVQETLDLTEKQLADVRRRMVRLQQAYDVGAYSPEEFATQRQKLKAKEAELMDEERQKEAAKRRQAEQEDGIKSFHDIVTHPKFPTWITDAEPRQVQFWLGKYFKITAYGDKTVRVKFINVSNIL